MLAIVTSVGDHTADWLILELHRRKAPFVRLNTDDYPRRWRLLWRPGEAWVEAAGRRTEAGSIDAVWWRRPTVPELSRDLRPDVARWAQAEAAEALEGVWRSVEARWVNRPAHNRAASNKPAQLALAHELGLDIPDTVVTNEREQLEELFARSPHGVICKPLSDGRVVDGDEAAVLFTSQIGPAAIEALGPEPCLFQALVPKRYDVRVTVIGDRVFATRIDVRDDPDAAVDWRRAELADLRHEPEALPDEIAESCAHLAARLSLSFAAIDLARRPDGGYTFFEVNPNGQWAWIEQATGQPLRSALADLLLLAS